MSLKSFLFLLHIWFNFRFHEHWRFVLQRLVFLSAFVVYLEGENLVTREEVAQILGSRYQLVCYVKSTQCCLFLQEVCLQSPNTSRSLAFILWSGIFSPARASWKPQTVSDLKTVLSNRSFSLCSWGGAGERISPGCGGLPRWRADHGKWTGESTLKQRIIYMLLIDFTNVLIWVKTYS